LLLAQFAKEKQRAAQATNGANRSRAELARPRIIPNPVAGTIEFEHGQIVAKIGGWKPGSNGPFQPSLCSGHTLWPCAMHEQCLSGRFTGDLKSGVRHAVLPSRLSRCCISGIGPRLSSPLTKKITASPPSEAEVGRA
jgi:hypothetical protein